MSKSNLEEMFHRADKVDRAEGRLAYPRYHQVMAAFVERYGFELGRVIAAFVA